MALHLGINYLGVRGLVLRTLNRQRLALAWTSYRSSSNITVPSPTDVSQAERIITHPGVFRDAHGRVNGKCTIGLSFLNAFSGHFPSSLFDLFEEERYLLWYDAHCLRPARDRGGHTLHGPVHLHIILKSGYTLIDQLKAWVHAVELCSMAAHKGDSTDKTDPQDGKALSLIHSSYERTVQHFPDFIARMRIAGWNTIDGALMPGSPKGVLMAVHNGMMTDGEDKGEEKKVR